LKPSLRAVVFDLDGTLIDSMPMVMLAYAHALAPFRPDWDTAKIFSHLGGPPERMFTELLTADQCTTALQRLHKYSLENWQSMQPFTGMQEILDDLRARYAVALWTGRDRNSAEWLLREHGIVGKLSACVCGDDLNSHKPDPAGLAEVLRQLAVTSDEALFVGDADVDVIAGAALGVRTVLITHGRSVAPQVQTLAWRKVETAVEAYALLRQEVATE
jgi:pyrophosphatase PpaX